MEGLSQQPIPVSNTPPVFTHMVLGGGGLKGLAYIGALRYMYQENLTKDIIHVSGTSVGALFAAAFVLGIPIEEIEAYFKELLDETNNLTNCDMTNILHIYDKLGFDDGKRLVSLIRGYAGNTTFLELAKKSGKNLIVCATNASTMTAMYFSVEHTPNVIVADAVRASMSIPLVFMPVQIGEDYYIDGCVSNGEKLPIFAFPKNTNKHNVLILNLSSTKYATHIDVKNANILTYLSGIIHATTTDFHSVRMIVGTYPYIINYEHIPVESLPITYTNTCAKLVLSEECIDTCFALGYTITHNHFKKWLTLPL